MPPSNRHPVDQLAQVRAQIKELQEWEASLKEQIISSLPERPELGEMQRIDGDDFVADVSLIERETLDRKAAEKLLGKRFPQALKTSSSITIRVSARAQQEAA
jgi:hypothetical protein